MPSFSITDEATVFPGTLDTSTSPAYLSYPSSRHGLLFEGEDGDTYTILHGEEENTGGSPNTIYRVNKLAGTRTVVTSFGYTEISAGVLSVAGLSNTSSDDARILGVLYPTNYFLCVQVGIGGASNATTFSLWKINASSTPTCVSAIRFAHTSSVQRLWYRRHVAAITGNRTNSDAIVAIHGGSSSWTEFRAWRLPGINQFISLNGTSYSTGVTAYNSVQIQGAYNEIWGVDTTVTNGGPSERAAVQFGWLLPQGSDTRYYYYVGRSETSTTTGSDFVDSNAATYPGGFFGYINLGNVNFSDSSQWTPSTTRHINNSLIKTHLGADAVPFTLVNANIASSDTNGYGDYDPGPTVKKLSDGTFLVIFGATLQYRRSNQYSGYTSYNLLSRWMAFSYNPTTGVHTLVGKGTFNPCALNEFNDGVDAAFLTSLEPYSTVIDYDEETNNMFFSISARFWSDGSGTQDRNIFGVLGSISLADGYCFLEETDETYYDFVARYP